MAILGALGLTSCSGDDDGSDGGIDKGDFIEVTFDGKTYKKNVFGAYALVPVSDDLVYCCSIEDAFSDKGFDFFYGFTMPKEDNDVLNSSTGTYRAVESIKVDNVKNFDFVGDLEIYTKDEFYFVVSGTHKVTSICKADRGVEIEGTFDLKMDEFETYEIKQVKGKYRMTTEFYYGRD